MLLDLVHNHKALLNVILEHALKTEDIKNLTDSIFLT